MGGELYPSVAAIHFPHTSLGSVYKNQIRQHNIELSISCELFALECLWLDQSMVAAKCSVSNRDQ